MRLNPTAYDIRVWVATGRLSAEDLLRTLDDIRALPTTNERNH